jgi:hypothetical protein
VESEGFFTHFSDGHKNILYGDEEVAGFQVKINRMSNGVSYLIHLLRFSFTAYNKLQLDCLK